MQESVSLTSLGEEVMIFSEVNFNVKMKKIKFFSSYCSEEQIFNNIVSSWGKGSQVHKDIMVTQGEDYEYAVLLNLGVQSKPIDKNRVIGFSHETRMTGGIKKVHADFISENASCYYISDNTGLPDVFKNGFCYVCPAEFGKSQNEVYPHHNNMSMIMSLSRFMPGHKMRYKILERVLDSDMDIHFYANGLNNVYSDPRVKEFDWSIFHVPYENYKFQIVAENILEKYWATEKLTNCIIKETLPIYYGSKHIADDFYGKGTIPMLSDDIDMNMEIIRSIYYDAEAYENNRGILNEAKNKLYLENNLLEFLNEYFKER